MAREQHAKSVVRAAARARPNLLKEIAYGLSLAVFGASFWKIYHLNQRRQVEEFYDRLEKGEITVEVVDPQVKKYRYLEVDDFPVRSEAK